MKYVYSVGFALAFVALAALPSPAHAATVEYSSYASIQARLQALILEVQRLQAELARLQSLTRPSVPIPNYGCSQYSYYGYADDCPVGLNRLRDIEVDFDDNFARVRIEYTNGRSVSHIYAADTREEVIDFLMDDTGHARSQIQAVISYDGDEDDDTDDEDVDRIRVRISSGDAHVTVYYDDGDTDTFTIDNETNHNDIIEEVADELNMDEDDVEDLITFSNTSFTDDDVDEIDVTIYDGGRDSRARVRYEDGDTDTFFYDTDDEDEIIEELADDLDMDEDDVEDLVDFEHID